MSKVKFFHSSDVGAPILNNVEGSMIALLDACLITGFGNKTVGSLVVSNGVATATCLGHGFSVSEGKMVRISGATPAELNGDWLLSGASMNSFSFLCDGIADGEATGAITAKRAPLDWVKQYSDTNLALYKRSDTAATGYVLRVDDRGLGSDGNTSKYAARVLMAESATDINTLTNTVPNTTVVSDGYGMQWFKGDGTTSAADWALVGDGFCFYLFVNHRLTVEYYGHKTQGFGDFSSFKPGDLTNCFLIGQTSSGVLTSAPYSTPGINWASSGSSFVARGFDGVTVGNMIGVPDGFGRSTDVDFPSPVDGGLIIRYPVLVKESKNSVYAYRGVWPGIADPLANMDGALVPLSIVDNILGTDKKFLFVRQGTADSSFSWFLIDLTGPWR